MRRDLMTKRKTGASVSSECQCALQPHPGKRSSKTIYYFRFVNGIIAKVKKEKREDLNCFDSGSLLTK